MDNSIWRVEATFTHLDKPVTYRTDDGKRDAYKQVADWLMSKNIQRIRVWKNDRPHQEINVADA